MNMQCLQTPGLEISATKPDRLLRQPQCPSTSLGTNTFACFRQAVVACWPPAPTEGYFGKYAEYYSRLEEDGMSFYWREETCKLYQLDSFVWLAQFEKVCCFLGHLPLCFVLLADASCTTSIAGNLAGERNLPVLGWELHKSSLLHDQGTGMTTTVICLPRSREHCPLLCPTHFLVTFCLGEGRVRLWLVTWTKPSLHVNVKPQKRSSHFSGFALPNF